MNLVTEWMLARTRRLRPHDFAMPPGPVRGMALEAVQQIVQNLLDHGAVDGANADVLDQLVEAWLKQWCEQLVPELTARQAAIQRLIGPAEIRVEAARGRVAASRLAYDSAVAAYHEAVTTAATTRTTTATTAVRTPVRLEKPNGVRPPSVR